MYIKYYCTELHYQFGFNRNIILWVHELLKNSRNIHFWSIFPTVELKKVVSINVKQQNKNVFPHDLYETEILVKYLNKICVLTDVMKPAGFHFLRNMDQREKIEFHH